jgi:hypothetical protein
MSYYKNQPRPQRKPPMAERLDETLPRYFVPTYERRDFKHHTSEWVLWIVGLVTALLLIVAYAPKVEASYPLDDSGRINCSAWEYGVSGGTNPDAPMACYEDYTP